MGCRWEGVNQLGTEDLGPAKWQDVVSRVEGLRGRCLASSCWVGEGICEVAAPCHTKY